MQLARSVRIAQRDTTLTLGSGAKLSADVLDSAGAKLTTARVSWNSENALIATVDSTGLVAATGLGTTRIVAAFGALADAMTVSVVQKPVVPDTLLRLGLWPDTNVLFTGMERSITLTVERRSGQTTEHAQWATSDPAVATVVDGVVTAVGAGQATVTAVIEDLAQAVQVFVVPAPSPALKFVSGSRSCGLTDDGRLFCWYPLVGMEGPFDRCRVVDRTGTTPYRCSEIPRLVSNELRFTAINDDCALAVGGAIYCWGANGQGQLGLGTVDQLIRGLTRVPVDGEFVEIAGTAATRCARRADGTVYCWGDNFRGNTGTGSVAPAVVTSPTPINTTVRFRKLARAGNCGLAQDSTAYCWGGFVGDSAFAGCNTACNPTPTRVDIEKLVDISAALYYCGIGVSTRTYCWGFHGDTPYRYPNPKEFPNPGFSAFEAAGFALDANGAVYKLDSYGDTWRFSSISMNTKQSLRFKRFWGTCGLALDDKLYCGDWVLGDFKRVPGQ